MRCGDAVALGRLMNASHDSLRHDFAVSSRELDVLVEYGRLHPACLGIRMTGAGFGGCAVALVREDDVHAFASVVAASYQSVTGLSPVLHVCAATDGAAVISSG